MSSPGYSELASLPLDRNPFFVLGASARSTRTDVQDLAEERLLATHDDAFENARRILTHPRQRLQAEIGWLPGIDAKVASGLITGMQRNPLEVDIQRHSALCAANLVAFGIQRFLGTNAGKNHAPTMIPKLVEAGNRLNFSAIQSIVNVDRAQSGFRLVDEEDVREVVRERERYFASTTASAIVNLPLDSRNKLLLKLLQSPDPQQFFLHTVIDAYAVRIQQQLLDFEEEIRVRSAQIMSSSRFDQTQLFPLQSALRQYADLGAPVFRSRTMQGFRNDQAEVAFYQGRACAIHIAKRFGEVAEAQNFARILRRIVDSLPKLAAPLNEFEVWLRSLTVPVQPAVQREMQSVEHRRSEEELQVRQAVPFASQHPATVPASGSGNPPRPSILFRGLVGVIAVLCIWGVIDALSGKDESDANTSASTSSNSRAGTSNVDRCENIMSWWDGSMDRWDRVLNIYNSLPYSFTENQAASARQSISAISAQQSFSNPPTAARQFNNSFVQLMEHMENGLWGTQSASAWESEYDSLFSVLEFYQQQTADECNITLVD